MRRRAKALRLAGVAGALVLAQVCTSAVGLDGPAGATGVGGDRHVAGRSVASAPPVATLAPPADPAKPRVAFTDDRDSLGEYGAGGGGGILKLTDAPAASGVAAPPVGGGYGGPTSPSFADAGSEHEGEPSYRRVGTSPQREYTAFVSTRDTAEGDVYVSVNGTVAVRIADPGTQSHPVVSPDGCLVAYASHPVDDPSDSTIRVASTPGAPATCGVPLAAPAALPNQAGNNEWPTWVADGATSFLVYSSDRDNPLGDLYAQVGGVAGVADGGRTRLTDGGGDYGTTQPTTARGRAGSTPWVLLATTTKFRSDGSLGEVVGTADAVPAAPLQVVSAWRDGDEIPQSSEAAVQPEAVAFTSTAANPLGSVLYALARPPTPSEPPFVYDPTQLKSLVDGAEPNRPASHPAWTANGLVVTLRRVAADVADAQADDGSDRDTVAHTETAVPGGTTLTLDNATPAYSPDGTRIAYSRRVDATQAGGRRLYVADADGSGADPVADGFRNDARPGAGETYYDLWPSWSPDGSRIAFVRAVYSYSGLGRFTEVARAIWIADLTAGTASQLTPGADDSVAVYGHPSWSPDGTRIVVSRGALAVDLLAAVLVPANSFSLGTPTVLTVRADNLGGGRATGAAVAVDAPPGLELSPSGTCPGTAARVVCSVGTVRPGERGEATVQATATSEFTNATLTATVTTSADDYNPSNDEVRTTVSTLAADLDVVNASAGSTTLQFGESTTIDVTVKNQGPGSAQTPDLVVEATTTAISLAIVSGCTALPDSTSKRIHCSLPVQYLTSGSSTVPRFSATYASCGTTTNITATVSSSTRDGNAGNNTYPRPGNTFQITTGVCGPKFAPDLRPAAAAASGPVLALLPAAVTTASQYVAADSRGLPGLPQYLTEQSIWTITLATGALTQLHTCTDLPADRCPLVGRTPSWSPVAADRIAYDDGGSLGLAVLDDVPSGLVDTTASRALVGFSGYTPGTGGTPTDARQTLESAHDPAWTPDGTLIYFTGQPAGAPSNPGIYSITPTGTGLRVVAQNLEPESEPTVQASVDLAVTIGATPATITPGGTSTVTVTVENLGDVRAANTVLTVTVPAGLTYTPPPNTPPTNCTAVAGGFTCDLETFAGKATRTFTFDVSTTTLGTYTIGAQVTTDSVDVDPTNNTARTQVVVRQFSTDLAVTLTADPSVIILGSTSTLTARVTNGDERAVATVLTLSIAAGLTPGEAPPGCTLADHTLTCAYGDLLPGDTRTAAIVVTGPTVGTYPSTATVTTGSTDPDPSNNSAVATVEVRRYLADVGVTLTADPDLVKIDDSTVLRARVRNNGSELALATVLTVQIAADLVPGAAPAGCTLVTRTLTCAFGDLPAGTVRTVEIEVTAPTLGTQTSIATVTTDSNDEVPGNDLDTADVRVVRRLVDVAVSVRFDRGTAYVGGGARVRVTVRNNGPSPADNVRLDTDVPARLNPTASPSCAAGGSTCELGTLAPGASRTYVVTLRPEGLTPTPRNYRRTAAASVTTTSDEAVTANNVDRDELLVRQPTVRLLPPIGPPGFVTVVFGENMPPGSLVRLRWSTGITSTTGAVRVAADGTVQTPMLVVRRDGDLGLRKLYATSVGTRFSRVSADMLVVPRTQSPPDFVGRG